MKNIEPIEFAEKYIGVKLLTWQKVYLTFLYKNKDKSIVFPKNRRKFN